MEENNRISDAKSLELQEIITNLPSWIIRNGNLLLFAIISLLFLLTFFIKYPETVEGKVIITSKNPPQKIYSNQGGKIDSLFYENNDSVDINQPIALIQNSANYLDVLLLKNTIDNNEIDITSINFPIDDLPVLLLGEIEPFFSEFEKSYIEFLMLNEYRGFEIKSKTNIFDLEEKKRKLNRLYTKKKYDDRELILIKEELQRYKMLLDKGVISKQEYSNKEIDYLNFNKLKENTLFDISSLNNEINGSSQNLKLQNIEKLRKEKSLIKEIIQNYSKLRIAIKEWEKKYLIKTNKEGFINYNHHINQNDFIQEKELFATIIPKIKEKPMGRLAVPVKNSGKIKIGQRVNIELDNYPYIEYGILIGKIKQINLVPSDDNLYYIDVEVNNTLTTSYKKNLPFLAEMQGTGKIITDDLRLTDRAFNMFRNLTKNQ